MNNCIIIVIQNNIGSNQRNFNMMINMARKFNIHVQSNERSKKYIIVYHTD